MPKERDPTQGFDQLELLTGRVEEHYDHDRHREHQQADGQADVAGQLPACGWEQHRHDRPGQRGQPKNAQPRDHHNCTTKIAAIMRVAPASIDSA